MNRRRFVGWIAAGPHVIVAEQLDVADFSQLVVIDETLFRLYQMLGAAALRADLHDAA